MKYGNMTFDFKLWPWPWTKLVSICTLHTVSIWLLSVSFLFQGV